VHRRTDAPGPYFQKEFFHNGYIKSLKQLVHFYNTRDKYRFDVESGHCPAGTTEKVNCWPAAEVPQNQDMTVGNLGLTDQEENQIVNIHETLTDGFHNSLSGHRHLHGRLHEWCKASTQGNKHDPSSRRVTSRSRCTMTLREGYEGAWSTLHAPSTGI